MTNKDADIGKVQQFQKENNNDNIFFRWYTLDSSAKGTDISWLKEHPLEV